MSMMLPPFRTRALVRTLAAASAAGCMLVAARPAVAGDLFVAGGTGNGVSIVSLGWRTDAWRSWTTSGGTRYELSGEAQLSHWNARHHPASNDEVWDIGFTPTLRVYLGQFESWQPYAEAGLGAHLISDTTIGDRHLSTAYQFGEFLGLGFEAGAERRFGAGVRLQHISNGSISEPNDGITYTALVLRYRF